MSDQTLPKLGVEACRLRPGDEGNFLHGQIRAAYFNAENLSYDSAENGEKRVLEKLNTPSIIFDVGANSGAWAVMAQSIHPNAEIHCFEIVPHTFLKLSANLGNRPLIKLNDCGLSNSEGSVAVNYYPNSDERSSMIDFLREPGQSTVEARVTRGDTYCSTNSITKIDFLKIDTEGCEPLVLEGFRNMITSGKIDFIQFEYGLVNIVTKYLLIDFYKFFSEHGYQVGKIFPNFVDFKKYDYVDENFIGPNFLAARNDLVSSVKGY